MLASYLGAVLPWSCVTIATWHHGAIVPLAALGPEYHDAILPWRHGTMAPQDRGAMAPLRHGVGSIVPGKHGKAVPWHHCTVPR